jgi:hypothetical protein
VPAYAIAYSHAPKNMRGLVSAINLFTTAISYALGLAFAGLIKDPYLTWDFGAPTIIGFVMACIFYWLYRDLDADEYHVSQNGDYHLKSPNGERAVSEDRYSQNGSGIGKPEISKETGGVSSNEKDLA